MGRGAALKCLEQEAEPLAGGFGLDSQQPEDLLLGRRVMDPDRAAARLRAVDDQVVGDGPAGRGVALEEVEIVGAGSGERVVHGGPASGLGVAGKHREVDHPGDVHGRRVK